LIYYRVSAGKFPMTKKGGDKTTAITPSKPANPATPKKEDAKKDQNKK
jgi:hypothetical protein